VAKFAKICHFFHLHGGATYMQKQHIHGATVQVDSPHTTSDSAEH